MVKLLVRQTKMTQKLKILIVAIIMAAPLGGLLSTGLVSAADPATTLKPSDCPPPSAVSKIGPTAGQVCKKVPADCPSGKVDKDDDSKCLPLGSNPVALKDNLIVQDLNKIVNVLSGLVGVVVVGTIILGGIQFATAGDKADAVSAAKKRITNGVLALVVFLFIFAFLQWLIPGGIFS